MVTRYFFHARDGIDLVDPVGTEFATEKDARREAIRVMGALFQVADHDPDLDDWRLEATDGDGRIRFVLRPQFASPET